MINISVFLDKFKKFSNDKISQKERIAKNIGEIIGVSLSSENIDLKSGVLYIKTSPVVRQEIFLKKQTLLERLSVERIIDIR